MPSNQSPAERYDLITRSLEEVIGAADLKALLEESAQTGKEVSLYWGSATTGRPHLGYFVPTVKLSDFLCAGVKVKVLLADVHGFLDNLKAPFALVAYRAKYYQHLFVSLYRSLNLPLNQIEFVTGSSYQYSEAYTRDKFKLSAITTTHDAIKAGAEVVKQTDSPLLSSLIYPLMQALDEEYLGVQIQFGGVDQRKIFTFAAEALPKIGYAKRIHLMNPMVPSMSSSGKMSSSDPDSKIDFLDPPEVVKSKIKKAVCAPKEVEGNGVLAFCEYVLFPVAELKVYGAEGVVPKVGWPDVILPDAPEGTLFSIKRDEKYGGNLNYSSYASLKADYVSGDLFPADLKAGVLQAILSFLKPIQEDYKNDVEWQEAEREGYGGGTKPEEKKKKKEKTTKEDYERMLAENKKKEEEAKGVGVVPEPPKTEGGEVKQ